MKEKQIVFKKSRINYYILGSGPKAAICFHGYGQEASSFTFLEKYIGNQYTFYSLDLPFHGKTKWKDGLIFTHTDLQQIIEKIIRENNVKLHLAPGETNFKPTLIGFSLGGRVALSFLEANPKKVEKLILLAPDGLKVNFWYWLATQTWPGNKFFAFTLKHPGWFVGFLKLLNKMRLVNTSIFKFVNYYIGDITVRQLLYLRWTTLRKLKPDLHCVKSLISKNNIPVRLIYGKHDRIILSSVGEKFKKGIEQQCTLTIIHSGHQVLHEKHVEEILPALLH